MKKIIKYFPLNKGIVEEEIKTLIKAIAIYLGTAIVVLTIANVTDWIPVVKNLTFNLSNIYGYYILVGIVLACYQYFMGKDYSEEEFVTLNDVKALWNLPKGKIIFATALVALCLIPHNTSTRVEEDMLVEETNTETDKLSMNGEEVDVQNEELSENIEKSDVEIQESSETVDEEMQTDVKIH